MAQAPVGGMTSPPPSKTTMKSDTSAGNIPFVSGTTTSWHTVVLWFLGSVALLALADPAPTLATGLVVLLILGTLLNNWGVYKSYLGLK